MTPETDIEPVQHGSVDDLLPTLFEEEYSAFREGYTGDDEDDAKVEYYLRKLARIDRELAELKERYEWLREVAAKERRALDSWTGQHVQAIIARRISGKRQRSLKYLSGTLGFRKQSAKTTVDWEDKDQAIEAAETACPDAVTVTERKALSKTALTAFLEGGGEVPGVHLVKTPEQDRFYATFVDHAKKKKKTHVPEQAALPEPEPRRELPSARQQADELYGPAI